MGKIYAIAIEKGGQAKTTTTINLAYCLYERKKKVLVVDMDGQANATFMLTGHVKTNSNDEFNRRGAPCVYTMITEYGVPQYDPTAYTVSSQYQPTEKNPGKIDMIVSNQMTEYVEAQLPATAKMANLEGNQSKLLLAYALDALRDSYDYILIDTPPSIGALTQQAVVACDYVILPFHSDYTAEQGADSTRVMIDRLQRELSTQEEQVEIKLAGCLNTIVENRVQMTEIVKGHFEKMEYYGKALYKTVIRKAQIVNDSQDGPMPVCAYAPASNPAKDYEAWTDEFLAREKMMEGER